VRVSDARRRTVVPRTGSARRPRHRQHVRRRARTHAPPLSELTAMENGSYPNGIDALRSSPLAAPQGPGFQ